MHDTDEGGRYSDPLHRDGIDVALMCLRIRSLEGDESACAVNFDALSIAR